MYKIKFYFICDRKLYILCNKYNYRTLNCYNIIKFVLIMYVKITNLRGIKNADYVD